MWWRNACRFAVTVLVAATLVGAAGCQVRPLYLGEATGAAVSPIPDLKAIRVDDPASRTEQVLTNELLFLLRGEASANVAPRYRLRLILTDSTNPLAVELEEDLPAAILVQLAATFILSEIDTEATLLTGSAVGSASYDFSSQRFANVRAERDAKARAAKQMAESIAARIASYFAARRKDS